MVSQKGFQRLKNYLWKHMDMMIPLASFLIKQGEQTNDDSTSEQVTTDCLKILPGMTKLETGKAF
jgi:hypothetical protein